ncbi:MAG: nucleoside phosphorylase [Chloroflexota bacterium]
MTSSAEHLPDCFAPTNEPVFSAADLLAYKRERGILPNITPPRAVIFTFQKSLIDYVTRHHPTKKVGGFYGELFLFKRTEGRVALAGNFGIGAPVTAALADELAAFGVRQFAVIGLAGGLGQNLKPGDLVIGERALRGEGTSAHYLPPGPWAEADAKMVQGWSRALTRRGQAYTLGATWTTDAPFRELRQTVLEHQRNGIHTVEMEAAALLAVAKSYNLPAAAAFSIADTLIDGRWRLSNDPRPAQKGLEALFESLLDYLTSER